MVTSSHKTLGEGFITQVDRKCATVNERRGTVLVNTEALSVNYPKSEMRDIFKNNDEVVLTFKQEEGPHPLVATSIVKKSHLISVEGKISEACTKYCYVDCSQKKIGKIFVPYSARSPSLNRTFMGKGVEKGKDVKLKIFRQSQPKNQCAYIAWGINIPGEERFEEQIEQQCGVIVSCVPGKDIIIYSATSGCSKLSYAEKKPWMDLGKFVKYSIDKLPAAIECVPKVQWMASNCEDRSKFLKYETGRDTIDETKLHLLNVPAIVNRVSVGGTAWFWNDNIGRIFYNGGVHSTSLKQMDVVSLNIVFARNYEEVPWEALHVSHVAEGEKEIIQNSIAKYVHTDDDWTVTFVREQGVFIFLNNPTVGAAFAGWTDLADIADRAPLKDGDKCRVTYYSHLRDRKNPFRALLVTPLDQLTTSQELHPILNVSIEGSEFKSDESEDSNHNYDSLQFPSKFLESEKNIVESPWNSVVNISNQHLYDSDIHLKNTGNWISDRLSPSTLLSETAFNLDPSYGTMTDLWGTKAITTDNKGTQTDDFLEHSILLEILKTSQIEKVLGTNPQLFQKVCDFLKLTRRN